MKAIIILSCITLVSCTSTQFVSLNTIDNKSPNTEIYLKDLQNPVKEFEVLSFIETTGALFSSKNDLIIGLKKKAKKLGGDAVIDVEFFYIPWACNSLPAVKGVLIKYK